MHLLFFSNHCTTPAQCWTHDLARGLNSSRFSWVQGSGRLGQTGRCSIVCSSPHLHTVCPSSYPHFCMKGIMDSQNSCMHPDLVLVSQSQIATLRNATRAFESRLGLVELGGSTRPVYNLSSVMTEAVNSVVGILHTLVVNKYGRSSFLSFFS